MKTKKLNQVTDFDIKLLKIFKTVSETGSFTAAESLLGISRSAISLHMSDLEKRLGVRLCQRGRAGFSLTHEGQEILNYTDTLIASIEDFRLKVNQIHKKLKGDLNIGIINNLVTMPKSYITHTLKQLTQESSEVQVNISMSTLADIECKVMDGRLHLGAIPLVTPLSGLDYFDLYAEQSFLYCGKDHPLFEKELELSHSDLHEWNAVMPSYTLSPKALQLYQNLNCTATASDREGIAFLILTGNFIGFLPDHYAKKWVENSDMKPLFIESFHYDTRICLVTSKGKKRNMIVESFFEKITDIITQNK
ncbi:LysR family transcriptional regulator [Acinetobacter stercoris]|uniref:HTH-type transcriptional activator AllS n=1 Tax=Acinetobacter stercoris TaxID=2126983 RepID=A0A2U3MUN7_9GAMM|nr:LysR family transcriptional regulator [Acinetobacter stercoris]SPL69063.1 HTH-type transcriptional activator AllS [Acinetobacter stercoris]